MQDEAEIRASAEWHFLTRFPPKYLNRPHDILLFRRWIFESDEAFPGFVERLREVALFAVTLGDVEIARQALQCLATGGRLEDCERLQFLKGAADPLIRRDLATCQFEMKRR